jgi:hypothetical protein
MFHLRQSSLANSYSLKLLLAFLLACFINVSQGGRSSFTNPGSYTWVVPSCVTNVSVWLSAAAEEEELDAAFRMVVNKHKEEVGGAGGFLCNPFYPVQPSESINVVVGAGGLLGDVGNCVSIYRKIKSGRTATNGGYSMFGSLKAVGGGGEGANGGSGGGAHGSSTIEGKGVPGQGYDGGDASNCDGTGYYLCGGGGGGAGGPGLSGEEAGVSPAPGLQCNFTGADFFAQGGGVATGQPTALGSGGSGGVPDDDGNDGVSGVVYVVWPDCPSPSATSSASASATTSATATVSSSAIPSSSFSPRSIATQTIAVVSTPAIVSISILSFALGISLTINVFKICNGSCHKTSKLRNDQDLSKSLLFIN